MIINILNDSLVWRVLLLISYSKGRGYRFSEIKNELKMNNSSLYKILDKLEFYEIIEKKNNIIKINFLNPISEKLFEIIEIDKKKFNGIDFKIILILIDFISKIDRINSIKNIYLFGSVAKRTNTKNSDIDIAIIYKKNEPDLFEIIYKFEEKYGQKIEIHQFEEKDFKNNKKSKLIEEIKRDGILLK